ncbi:organic solute transporter Ostalpha-domain-containing protein [Mariannaea sp. PMI_226]|nr:organic solute transporter Ostalpha-domain-containing protein [Mariannaea sp. PMI_226]
MWLHAINYTKPREQRQILRILFMVPVYSIASFAQIVWYQHAVYIEVISTCYEAFALAAFFALVCHYVAPDVHLQKVFFREMKPIKPWIFPLNLFAKCCGGQRGPWRTPRSGLTWFNICWISVYQYIFWRIISTVIAVTTEVFEKYCESSNSPVFAHIWVSALNMAAVTIAMVCIVQVYAQLREPLVDQKLFTKILAIKLVIFLVLWQTVLLSVGTSTMHVIKPTATISFPDLKVGIPNLLVCVEMAFFALFHFWAFSYRSYRPNAPRTFYPVPDANAASGRFENKHQPPSGGFLGILAFIDALNPWDLVKAFARGVRWLFCGFKQRKADVSYANSMQLNSRSTSPRRTNDALSKPLVPGGIGADEPSAKYPTSEDERYEPMRRDNHAHYVTPEPYEAGNTFGASPSPQPPPYRHDTDTSYSAYRPYGHEDESPYAPELGATAVQPAGPLDSHSSNRQPTGNFF